MAASVFSSLDPLRRQWWEQERSEGTPLDLFLALSNLARELVPLGYGAEQIENTWFEYRDELALADLYRERPELFGGYASIGGLEHVADRLAAGGVLLLMHFGDYRHGPLVVTRHIRGLSSDAPIAIVVDQDSYQAEASLSTWTDLRREYNVDFLIAESPHVGVQLMRHLRRGGWVYVYLDGSTGSGADASPLELPFLSSHIRLRSGLFRLLARTGSPAIAIVTDRPDRARSRIVLSPPVTVVPDELERGVSACFEPFRTAILRQPELWRFWFRHHRQVSRWSAIPPTAASDTVDWRCTEVTPALGLSLASGRVFRLP